MGRFVPIRTVHPRRCAPQKGASYRERRAKKNFREGAGTWFIRKPFGGSKLRSGTIGKKWNYPERSRNIWNVFNILGGCGGVNPV